MKQQEKLKTEPVKEPACQQQMPQQQKLKQPTSQQQTPQEQHQLTKDTTAVQQQQPSGMFHRLLCKPYHQGIVHRYLCVSTSLILSDSEIA